MSNYQVRESDPIASNTSLVSLFINDMIDLQISDRPVFGSPLTVSEAFTKMLGREIKPGIVLGWVDYIEAKKFICTNAQNKVLDAFKYISLESNQIITKRTIVVHTMLKQSSSATHIISFVPLHH